MMRILSITTLGVGSTATQEMIIALPEFHMIQVHIKPIRPRQRLRRIHLWRLTIMDEPLGL